MEENLHDTSSQTYWQTYKRVTKYTIHTLFTKQHYTNNIHQQLVMIVILCSHDIFSAYYSCTKIININNLQLNTKHTLKFSNHSKIQL